MNKYKEESDYMRGFKKFLAILVGVLLPAIFYCTYTAIMYTIRNTPNDCSINFIVMILISCSFLYLSISAIMFAYNNLK